MGLSCSIGSSVIQEEPRVLAKAPGTCRGPRRVETPRGDTCLSAAATALHKSQALCSCRVGCVRQERVPSVATSPTQSCSQADSAEWQVKTSGALTLGPGQTFSGTREKKPWPLTAGLAPPLRQLPCTLGKKHAPGPGASRVSSGHPQGTCVPDKVPIRL